MDHTWIDLIWSDGSCSLVFWMPCFSVPLLLINFLFFMRFCDAGQCSHVSWEDWRVCLMWGTLFISDFIGFAESTHSASAPNHFECFSILWASFQSQFAFASFVHSYLFRCVSGERAMQSIGASAKSLFAFWSFTQSPMFWFIVIFAPSDWRCF